MTAKRDAYEWGCADGYGDQPYGISAGVGWGRALREAYHRGYLDGMVRRERESGG